MTPNNSPNSEIPPRSALLTGKSEEVSCQSVEKLAENSSIARSVERSERSSSLEERNSLYLLPETSLLDSPPFEEEKVDISEYVKEARRLEEFLRSRTLRAQVSFFGCGPSTISYEISFPAGLESSTIRVLKRAVMSCFRNSTYRFIREAGVDGNMILEIPREKPSAQLVYLQPLIESKAFTKQSSSGLAVVLGKDTRGEPVVFDLSESSHVLIHGRAGWESTAAIHEMLLSMLFRHTPENLRLIIIDTRIVEYVYFEGIPHLCQPLSDGLAEAMRSLSWVASEIERRENLMHRLGVGSLSSLNEQLNRSCRRETSIENRLNKSQPLPNIVIVIDDFGDLVLLYDKKVKDLLSKIMKSGAAVGVHVILATQPMNEDVISFSMKSYCRTILCFQTCGPAESKEILGEVGAEKLSRPNDMLCSICGMPLLRVQGVNVSMKEVMRVTDFWKSQRNQSFGED